MSKNGYPSVTTATCLGPSTSFRQESWRALGWGACWLFMTLATLDAAYGKLTNDQSTATTCKPDTPSASGLPDSFAAVWRADEEETTLVIKKDWNGFETERRALEQKGCSLFDLEKNEKLFVGLFRPAKDAHVLDAGRDGGGLSRRSLTQRRRELNQEGLRLIDLETWIQDGQRRYAGIWAPGRVAEVLVFGLTRAGFTAKRQELAEEHCVVDFETDWSNGALAITALWNEKPTEADCGSRFLIDRPWLAFHRRLHRLTRRDLFLVEIETVRNAQGERRFSGRIESRDGRDWFGVDYLSWQLEHANTRLANGRGSSGLDSGGVPEAPAGPTLATQVEKRWLSAVNILAQESLGTRNLEPALPGPLSIQVDGQPVPVRKPIHNAGTVGPPDDGP